MDFNCFNFPGGEILTKMGASWFVSYSYYEKIDRKHLNWSKVKTTGSRLSHYNKGRAYHEEWLLEVLSMNEDALSTNTIGLDGEEIKSMARELLKR